MALAWRSATPMVGRAPTDARLWPHSQRKDYVMLRRCHNRDGYIPVTEKLYGGSHWCLMRVGAGYPSKNKDECYGCEGAFPPPTQDEVARHHEETSKNGLIRPCPRRKLLNGTHSVGVNERGICRVKEGGGIYPECKGCSGRLIIRRGQ